MAKHELENWTPEEVKTAFDKGEIILVDVRTPQEYLFEHVEGALLLPMVEFESAQLPEQGDKRIVLHCGSGARSAKVGGECLANGFTWMAHMEGGFAAWKARKLPYIGTDMATGVPRKMQG